jgi:ubiquinone/menaquinone biosynthesis C-methylase UbiE
MVSSIYYYDHIAGNYNGHMTDSDNSVRKEVIKIFVANIPGGNILDFGGGTGLDLPGLLSDQYKVFFLEPSTNMRAIAIESVSEKPRKPVIIEERVNFQQWSDNHLPFTEKMNGVLANFAVLNCIPDVDSLFEKLAIICAPLCYVQATVIDVRPLKMIKTHSLKVAAKILFNRQLITRNYFNGIAQDTYLHTLQKYESASGKYFNLVSYKSIHSSNFALLILSRNEIAYKKTTL